MTRRSKDDLDRLERSLAEIHRACPTPFVGDEWAQRVMRDVRREAATAGKRVRPIDVYVWRTAAVAATFAAIFAGSVFLYTGSLQAHVIPKRAFLGEVEAAEFCKLAQAYHSGSQCLTGG